MAATLNLCSFIGHLGREPEIGKTLTGVPVTKFTLAVDEYGKKPVGMSKEKATLWLDIVCFRDLAETVTTLLKKGSQVYVQGRLSKRTYTDRNGVERTAIEIIANDIQLLDPKPVAQAASTSSETSDAPGNLDEPF